MRALRLWVAALRVARAYLRTIRPLHTRVVQRRRAALLYLPSISPISPLYLPYVSPISPLYLNYISPISPQATSLCATNSFRCTAARCAGQG